MRLPKGPRPQPDRTPQAEADRSDRLEREAAALRLNLRRRKDQHRAREAGQHSGSLRPSPGDGTEQ